MMHIYKSKKYRTVICRISQNPRNDRKTKTVKFLFRWYRASIDMVRKVKGPKYLLNTDLKYRCNLFQADLQRTLKCYENVQFK